MNKYTKKLIHKITYAIPLSKYNSTMNYTDKEKYFKELYNLLKDKIYYLDYKFNENFPNKKVPKNTNSKSKIAAYNVIEHVMTFEVICNKENNASALENLLNEISGKKLKDNWLKNNICKWFSEFTKTVLNEIELIMNDELVLFHFHEISYITSYYYNYFKFTNNRKYINLYIDFIVEFKKRCIDTLVSYNDKKVWANRCNSLIITTNSINIAEDYFQWVITKNDPKLYKDIAYGQMMAGIIKTEYELSSNIIQLCDTIFTNAGCDCDFITFRKYMQFIYDIYYRPYDKREITKEQIIKLEQNSYIRDIFFEFIQYAPFFKIVIISNDVAARLIVLLAEKINSMKIYNEEKISRLIFNKLNVHRDGLIKLIPLIKNETCKAYLIENIF